MIKKAKIIATLGPSIYSTSKLKKLIMLGVDAFRINFSHNTKGIKKIVKKIRNLEINTKKRIALIGDLQGIKLRIGKVINNSVLIKKNQKFIFDLSQKDGSNLRVGLPYSFIIKKIKINNLILIDDGKYAFKVLQKSSRSIITKCLSNNFFLKSNKSIHVSNIALPFNNLTPKDKADLKTAKKIGCNWVALSYLQNAKLIRQTRNLIPRDMGII